MSEQAPNAGPDDVPAEVPDHVDPAAPEPVEPTPLNEDDSANDDTGAAELDQLLAKSDG